MVTVSFATNIKEFKRGLSRFEKKQMPFAVSRGLNETAKVVVRDLNLLIPRRFDNPVPFTRKPFMILYSTPRPGRKNTLRATIRVKRLQAEYLSIEETGGTRFPKKTAIIIPEKIRTNRYGNLRRKPGGKKSVIAETLEKDPDTFSGALRGRSKMSGGLYKRIYNRSGKSTGLKLLISYQPYASYKPRFQFKEDATRIAQRQMPIQIPRALKIEVQKGLRK